MDKPPEISKAKLIFASTIIVLSLASAAFIPLVLMFPISDEMKVTLSGLLVFGIPQILTAISIIIVGKSGFNYLKQKFFGLIRKQIVAANISKTRYYIGLSMFVLPLFMGWLLPYVSDFIPNYEEYKLGISIGGDLMLLISFFVLGGEFWEKLRVLFIFQPDSKSKV